MENVWGKILQFYYLQCVPKIGVANKGPSKWKVLQFKKRMGETEAQSLKIKMMASYLHYLATNRCTNTLNQIEQIRKKLWIQIPSTDLGLYHQKALYNWFFMHKKIFWRKKWLKKLPPRGIEPRSPAWQAKLLTTRPSFH